MTTATAAETAAGAAVLRRIPAWSLTAVLAAVWLIVDPPTPDLAAHAYRADVADRIGPGIWEQGWYAGHHLPGYSVLMPPLAALLTPQVVAAAAVVVAAWCFERLATAHWSAPAVRRRVLDRDARPQAARPEEARRRVGQRRRTVMRVVPMRSV